MQYEELCREVEKQLQCKLKARSDFDYLSDQIEKKLNETLSNNTLMRLWGYRQSVNARRTTLDILARFVGCEDYAHFKAKRGIVEEDQICSEGDAPKQGEKQDVLVLQEQKDVPVRAEQADSPEQKELEEEKELPAPKRRWRWIAAALAALVLIFAVVAALRLLWQPQLLPKPVMLTDVSELRNDRQYFIHTREGKRGSLGIASPEIATTCPQTLFHHCDTASTFAIIDYEDSYYLYSTVSRRFISLNSFETDDPMSCHIGDKNCCAIDITREQGYFVFNYWFDKSLNRITTLNVNWKDGVVINNWGTWNGIFDNGNLFSIEDAGPFDPTEALEMLRKSAEKHKGEICRPDSLVWEQIMRK